MHFIVTGGAGFIGSHLTEQLLSHGHRVTVVDNLSTGSMDNLPNHPYLQFLKKSVLDCRPTDFLTPIHAIAHLSATPSVFKSWDHPFTAHHNNLSAMVAVIELCKALAIPRLVFASSAAVYGETTEIPISETQITKPISPYGLQKLVSEQYAQLFANKINLSFVSLRFFNVFGPRQDPTSPYSGVISLFTQAIAHNRPIIIYGNGDQTRDFIFVKDVSQVLTSALELNLRERSSLVCNVGTGQETSLIQLVNHLQKLFPGWNAPIKFAKARRGDIKHSCADISLSSSHLNFQPQYSIASGLKVLVESLLQSQR
jgi:UDP-glucose 4-epimerase